MASKHAHCGFCGRRFVEAQQWPRVCGGCGQTSFLNPLPVVIALVPVERGLLVIRRGIEPHRGQLALPGGFVDWGETWQQACARELREETGVVLPHHYFRERRVMSALPGLVLIFAESKPISSDILPPFAPTNETTERQVISAPIELAFPLHTMISREWFEGRRASD